MVIKYDDTKQCCKFTWMIFLYLSNVIFYAVYDMAYIVSLYVLIK